MTDERPNLFDSHAHLDFGKLAAEREGVLERAWAAGLRHVIAVGSGRGVEGAFDAVALACGDCRIWATVGVHPHDADLGVAWQGDPAAPPGPEVIGPWRDRAEQTIWRHRSLALHSRVVALGEVGLDFHYDHSPRNLQRELFRRYIRLARDLGLPLVIHAREAEAEVAAILVEEDAGEVGGVIHCFSGDATLARAGLDLGFHFGLTGVLTFKNADGLRRAVADLPLERLLIETDSPYLSPVPYRGKRNEPAFVLEVARQLAEVKGLSLVDAAQATTDNAIRLFGIDRRLRDRPGQIAYRLGNSVYLNVTNRCTLACRFCLKHAGLDLGGVPLGLLDEPDSAQLLAAVDSESAAGPIEEVVFCGIGEPLLRPDLVAEVGRRLRAKGLRVRVNTDGLANLVHDRDVLALLAGAVDAFSVSLNAQDAQTHAALCPSGLGPAAFQAVVDFIRAAAVRFDQVTATAVRAPGLDAAAVERLARSLGAGFRLRG